MLEESNLGTLSIATSRAYISDLFSQKQEEMRYAYRYSNQLNENPDLIVAGCSFTYGEGVLVEETWGNRLSDLMGVDSVTIGRGGWSMIDIVDGIFSHIRSKGNPKYIAVLSTELTRGKEAVDGLNVDTRATVTSIYPHISTITMSPKTIVKYSKKPHYIEDVTIGDSSIYRSIAHLNHLILYCKSLNIPMVWGTWDISSSSLFDYVLSDKELSHIDLGNYVSLPIYPIGINKNTSTLDSCVASTHAGLYDLGLDNGIHAGSHYHAHWAEEFYNKFSSIK